MFSARVGRGLERNRLAVAIDARRAAGLPLIDLTDSNPTRAGFDYPPGLLRSLSQPAALCYQPNPFGAMAARAAVSGDYLRRGVSVAPERIVLTSSTSEAYAILFKLLCDPGDVVLAPRPSYPLIEHLAELEGVAVAPFSLDAQGRWAIDLDAIEERLGAAGRPVRAIVLISPNNPTGSAVTSDELAELSVLARRHDAALIVDEVFADYPLEGGDLIGALSRGEALTFALGGLSKSVGLPQVKLGWIGVSGPAGLLDAALARLEIICDAYLSVSTPVQVAAGDLLREGALVRAQIQTRIVANYTTLKRASLAHPACSVLRSDGGWSAVVQIPAIEPEEEIVIRLLERTGVLVHPGYFFDFERGSFIVLSLLPPSSVFAPALEALFTEIERAA